MSKEKIEEFNIYIQEFWKNNLGFSSQDGVFHLGTIPNDIATAAATALKVFQDESILFFVNFGTSTLFSNNTGKQGFAITDIGFRFCGPDASWVLSWNELSEKFYIENRLRTDGNYELVFLSKSNPAAGYGVIYSNYTNIDCYAQIINKTCQIFTGKSISMQVPDAAIENADGPKCANCGAALAEGIKFCKKCGTKVEAAEPKAEDTAKEKEAVCANCKAPLEPGKKFCRKCGTKVEAAAEPASASEPPSAEKDESAQTELLCTGCGKALPQGAKFCLECGTKVELPPAEPVCSGCGKQLPQGAKFCLECGTKV